MQGRDARALLLAIGALLLFATALLAHTRLLRSDPSDGEVRADTVHVVRLWFSTPIDGTRDAIEVSGPDGRRVDGRNARVSDDDPTRLEVPVDALRGGHYAVRWTVISADGHPVSGAFAFHVERDDEADPAAIAEDPAAADPGRLAPLEAAPVRQVGLVAGSIGRWLHLLALVLALGPLALQALVVGGSRTPVARRLWAVAALGAALLLPAALLLLGVQAAALAGSWQAGLSRDTLDPVLAGRWGGLWQIRFGLALLLVWIAVDGVLRRATDPAARRPRVRLAAGLVTGALLIVASSLDGHAATTPPVALSVTADALHLSAAAAWIGGLFALTFAVLPALRTLPSPERAARLARYVPRFSTLAFTCVTVLVATGLYQSWQLVGGPANLTGTGYGRALLLKLAVFAVLLVPAGVNRLVLKPRLRRAADSGSDDSRRFRRLVAAEAALGIVVLAAAAVLTGLPPARTAEPATAFAGFTFEPPLDPPPIRVPLADGGTFDLEEQRGNVVLLFFGFTNCPDYCPLTLQEWRRIREQLGDAAARTRFVFVSVDPGRDSPAVAADYARRFDPSFIGLAPDSAEVSRIESGFYLRSMRGPPAGTMPDTADSGTVPDAVARDAHATHDEMASARASGEYDVMHSTRYFLIDQTGAVRVMYTYDAEPALVARDIRRLLRGQAPKFND